MTRTPSRNPCRLLAFLLLIAMALLPGCRNRIDMSGLNQLAKSDIDMIADTSQREMNLLMEDLLVKLYQHNPGELDKGRGLSVGQRKGQLFDRPGRLVFHELDLKQGTAALDLAFDPGYKGDRVFALMAGLVGMVRSVYNWQNEQYMFDSLDEKKLFDCARNLEVLAWRLYNTRDSSGALLLLSNGHGNGNSNGNNPEDKSFERTFGKMIAIQDLMAFTVAGKWDRGVNTAVKKVVFFPLGI